MGQVSLSHYLAFVANQHGRLKWLLKWACFTSLIWWVTASIPSLFNFLFTSYLLLVYWYYWWPISETSSYFTRLSVIKCHPYYNHYCIKYIYLSCNFSYRMMIVPVLALFKPMVLQIELENQSMPFNFFKQLLKL